VTEAADPLAGIELAIFDKDGTLIEFHLMWAGWVTALVDRLGVVTGRGLGPSIRRLMGIDSTTGQVLPHGALAATPMTRLRGALVDLLRRDGLSPDEAERATVAAWHSPDPVALARPIGDPVALLQRLRARGIRIAVATSDDRDPTERTLRHLGLDVLVDAVACADDGRPVKPAPDAVAWLCGRLGVDPARTAVIGDSPADLRMGRAAGAGRVIGVLTGAGDEASLAGLADIVLPSIEALVPGA
jgi:phosphoglycolate phosphatase